MPLEVKCLIKEKHNMILSVAVEYCTKLKIKYNDREGLVGLLQSFYFLNTI